MLFRMLPLVVLFSCGHSQAIGEQVPSDVDAIALRVEEGCHDAASDHLNIEGAELTSTRLRLRLRHGGGCEEHTYRLCPDPVVLRTEPGVQSLVVVHDAHGDECRAVITNVVEVEVADLPHSPLALGTIDGRSISVSVD